MEVRWLAVNRHRVQWVEVRCEKAHLLHPLVLQLIVLLHLHLPGATAPQVEGRGRRQWYCRRGVVAVLVLQLSVVSHLPGASAPEVAAMILDLVLAVIVLAVIVLQMIVMLSDRWLQTIVVLGRERCFQVIVSRRERSSRCDFSLAGSMKLFRVGQTLSASKTRRGDAINAAMLQRSSTRSLQLLCAGRVGKCSVGSTTLCMRSSTP